MAIKPPNADSFVRIANRWRWIAVTLTCLLTIQAAGAQAQFNCQPGVLEISDPRTVAFPANRAETAPATNSRSLFPGDESVPFTPHCTNRLSPPAPGIPFWVRFSVRTSTPAAGNWVLAVDETIVRRITVRETLDTGHMAQKSNGRTVPDQQRDLTLRSPAVGLALAPNTTANYLVRIDPGASPTVTLRLSQNDAYQEREFSSLLTVSLFIGFLAAIAAFVFILFINLRLRAVQFYCIYVLGIIVNSIVYEGLLFRFTPWTWPDLLTDRTLELSSTVAGLAFVQFGRSVLRLETAFPTGDRILKGFLLAFGLTGVVATIDPVNAAWPLHIVQIASAGVIGAVALSRALSGDRPAWTFTMSLVALFVGLGISGLFYYFESPLESLLGRSSLAGIEIENLAFFLGIGGEAVFMSMTILQLVKANQADAIQAAADGRDDEALELDDADRRFLDAFRNAVQTHLSERELGVSLLAKYMAMSERTLRRRVRDVCATTPAEFIRRQRLSHARTLLRNETYNTVAEVALAVGLSHSGHFARLYKELHGISPGEEARLAAKSEPPPEAEA